MLRLLLLSLISSDLHNDKAGSAFFHHQGILKKTTYYNRKSEALSLSQK